VPLPLGAERVYELRMTTAISRELLHGYEGLHISAICTAVRFVDDAQNHCAHFVNHVLAFAEPLTCGQLLGRPGAAANIRVHETFAHCKVVGNFQEKPADTPCYAFLTQLSAVNLAARTMANIPQKHIGIFCDGEIWHYSNTEKKVIRQTPEAYAKHFSGAGFAVFFGTFPSVARALMVPVQSARGATTAADLKRGQRDSVDVAVWQQFLIIRKLLSGPDVHALLDGNFGPKTEEATEAFQVSGSLPGTGVVDPQTIAAAIEQGFIPRGSARARTALASVTPAMTAGAVEALHRLGPSSVFYSEEVLTVGRGQVVARLEPHKHTAGTQLRFWHRGVTLYPFLGGQTSPQVARGHAGMDTSSYPGDAVMAHLRSNTNLVWTGFYLGPAPSHPNASWMTRRQVLAEQGWGLAPLYLGQQESGPGSKQVDGAHGDTDGLHAASLATEAGFAVGSVIYLDIETGGALSSAMVQYLERWCARVSAAGFAPGAYLSHTTAASARLAVPALKLWAFQIKDGDFGVHKEPPFLEGDLSGSGVAEASAWQWAQNCSIPKPGGRLLVDLDVASSADPSRA